MTALDAPATGIFARPASTHSEREAASTAPHNRSIAALLPIMGIVFVAFLVIGLALPVLPLHVHWVLASAHSWSVSSRAVSLRRHSSRAFGQVTTPIGEVRNAQ